LFSVWRVEADTGISIKKEGTKVSNTRSIDSLRPEIWSKELYKDVMDNLYFTANGMMGEGSNNIIEVKNDLEKQKGI